LPNTLRVRTDWGGQQNIHPATKGKNDAANEDPDDLDVCVAATVVLTRAPARADSAQDNYTAYCAKCHGADGRGDGPSAGSLATKPQDYTDCAAMQKVSDDTMFKVIKGGGASVGLPGDMPSWSDGLSDPEIHDLVVYLRTFCKKK
jgi:mono/diheme cytochrome c family protein